VARRDGAQVSVRYCGHLTAPRDPVPKLAHSTFLEFIKPVLPAREWARLEAYALDDAGLGTDVFGIVPEQIAPAYALAYWMHRAYFRVVSEGHESIPSRGAGVLVGNHSGVLPYDGLVMSADVFRNTDPPRLVRFMVEHFVFRLPVIGNLFRGIGQIPGTRRNFDGLLEEGHLIGVFPEGAKALGKLPQHRYQLLKFSHGFLELAVRHGVPVVPFGIVGAEEQQRMIANLEPVAKVLRLPFVPVTTTFPWLGPLGLLPLPSQYFITYGDPIHVDPAAKHSLAVREREVERVRDAVQDLLRRGQETRRRVQGEPR
jgi:1-acyl-sn-glycerol-3-phosphate acyltransferase